ncbi:MAG: hypothetical protein HFH80_13070 [Lachnospiraceae bacterium]|nr:hypothetical protein [Lachnospiraceae bacterium]
MKMSEKAYINRMAVVCHTVIDVVLILAYMVELLKGARTVGYICIFAAICLVPVIVEWILFKRNPDSGLIMHIIAVCYGILYIFAIFTANSVTNFVYAVPMFVVLLLYSDVRYTALFSGTLCLFNILDIVYVAMTVGYAPEQIADVEIRVASITLIAVFCVMTTMCLNKLNRQKLANLNAEKDKSTQMLNDTLELAGQIRQGIGQVTEKMEQLDQSVTHIRGSMKEVTQGSMETAESVQQQMARTGEIQKHIAQVKENAETIDRGVDNAAEMIREGRKDIDAMEDQVQKSMAANDTVLSRMEDLSAQTEKMNTIIEMITGITNQTSLLSLNASIEAARAGDAGKGFAVVAGEISSLANQTKSATVNITELIQNINAELKEVSTAIDLVTDGNRSHAVTARKVLGSFERIAGMTKEISIQTTAMKETVESLDISNAGIVESIQTISAITEEVSAHSNETYEACERNSEMVSEVTAIVENLNEETKKIRKNY